MTWTAWVMCLTITLHVAEHFITFSISSDHRNFFVPFPLPFSSIPWNNSFWLLFPNFGNFFSSFPSCSRILGMDFFHFLPVPEFWECFFFNPFRSRIMGMFFFIPFPFPNCGNGFFHSLPIPEFAISQTGIGILWEIPDFQYFQLHLDFLQQLLRRKIELRSLKVSDWKDKTFCSVLLQIVMLQRC